MSGLIRWLLAMAAGCLLVACEGTAVISSGIETPEPAASAATTQSDAPSANEEDNDVLPVQVDTQADTQADPQPTTPPRTYSAADITDLILVTGQSNALCTQTEYDRDHDLPHDRAFAFTNEGWRRADLHQVWDRNWFPRRHPDEQDPSNNFAFHMARTCLLYTSPSPRDS